MVHRRRWQGASETQFVTNLYEAFLQRGPDTAGLSFWVANAGTNNSTARQNVLNAFAVCGPFKELSGTLYREVFWQVADRIREEFTACVSLVSEEF